MEDALVLVVVGPCYQEPSATLPKQEQEQKQDGRGGSRVGWAALLAWGRCAVDGTRWTVGGRASSMTVDGAVTGGVGGHFWFRSGDVRGGVRNVSFAAGLRASAGRRSWFTCSASLCEHRTRPLAVWSWACSA